MKNSHLIDGAVNSVYDIFSATELEFSLIFPEGQDVAFIDEVRIRGDTKRHDAVFNSLWKRRIAQHEAKDIHGTLFCELEH